MEFEKASVSKRTRETPAPGVMAICAFCPAHRQGVAYLNVSGPSNPNPNLSTGGCWPSAAASSALCREAYVARLTAVAVTR